MALIREIIGSRQDRSAVFYFPGDDIFAPYLRSRAIPIGNLTSQFFANLYLNSFDHFIKEQLRCRFYIRYVDDFVIFGNDSSHLYRILAQVEDYLATLRLRLHPGKCRVYRVTDGVKFLGFRIFPNHRLLDKGNVLRMKRKLKQWQAWYRSGRIDLAYIHPRIQSWIGHAAHGNTYRLREGVLGGAAFQRGGT
jgi:retron-type reverse transcriptase